MKTKRMLSSCVLVILALLAIVTVFSVVSTFAVGGAIFTTVNETDGPDACLTGNPDVNCSIYGAKEYVWLNGGPYANRLMPDGEYFFAVLAPGGQPDPNDGGAKNLSDDFDTYINRTFTVTDGEISDYTGTHDEDLPLIQLFPYEDTTNPGGVYILAVCYLADGYPVDPRDCKYEFFTVMADGDG